MYCYHCGYKIDEAKVESQQSTYTKFEGVDKDTIINNKLDAIINSINHIINFKFK